MVEDLTVLLVGEGEPDETLFEQLEKKNLAVEISAPQEFSSLLALVEPHLVVHLGKEGAENTVKILKEQEEVRRVRLVLVAGRDDLPDLRRLDRAVVVSLLADDIAPSVVAARVLMLAKKGPDKSGRPNRIAKPPAAAPSSQKSPPTTAAKPAPTTAAKPAPAKIPQAIPAPPKTPPAIPAPPKAPPAKPPEPKPAPRPAPPPAPPKSAPASPPSMSKRPAIPRATSAKPVQPTEKKPAAAQSAAVPAPPLPAPVAATNENEEITSHGFDADSAEELTVAFDAPVPEAAKVPSGPRVILADTDMTRADIIACALREAGVETRIVPLDAAATHWALVREFGPTIALGDSAAFNGPGQVWLQLFQADQALKKAKIVAVPFSTLFNPHNGRVGLRTLVPQIPQLSGELPSEAKPTAGPTPPPQSNKTEEPPPAPVSAPQPSSKESEHEDRQHEDRQHEDRQRDDHDDEEDDDEFERMTVARPVDFLVPEEARSSLAPSPPSGILDDRSRQGSIADMEDLDVLDAVPPSHPSAKDPDSIPDGVPHRHTSRSAPTLLEGNPRLSSRSPPPNSKPPSKSRTGLKLFFFLVLVGVGGVGTWLAMGHEIAGFKLPSLRGTVPSPATAPPPAQEAKPDPKETAEPTDAPLETGEPGDPLWVVPPAKPVQSCEELVTNLEDLKAGGIQQATMSWNRARQKMVLGDLDSAHVLMCEAVLLHPESLALEGLASLYVTKRDPGKAQHWLDRALEARPDRTKTLKIQGDIYSLQGRIDEAKKALADSLKVSVDDQKTLSAVAGNVAAEAEQQWKGGATAQAELLYRRAIAMDPQNATAAAGMAASHAASGTAEGAQLWAERTLSLDDGNPVALVVQAALATEGGDADRAIELCKRALKRDPVYAPAHQLLQELESE